ncbi:hypothetical protein [Polyangium fumosum]|uniref:Uncharacterized protein n=1 Tax=Polyangium fumosum TaxID=889272 RepID=A0A4U1JDU2_9BACT|nr:hypothetical protein [Polyangium fumosum]TKD09144.1 hypothetical protein E8A74_12715 [Polyangium fumosum]
MTTIGDVLDEFFSPLSSEKLWIMPESDNYTRIVRRWQPVIDASNRTKRNLAGNCSLWRSNFVTIPSWQPTKTDAPKPKSYREFVQSPPGTDPTTCKNAFMVYVASKFAKPPVIPVFLPEIQTEKLYTCSIGSFNIYTSVNKIDCTTRTAQMNFWMYNSMSRRSFGDFASHPVFSLCGMATQYMWWNWVESVDWSDGTVRTVKAAGGGGGGW